MTKNLIFLFFLFLIVPTKTCAQNDNIPVEKTTTVVPDIEKVYLHTDRNYYVIGESLWYKAYSVYAYTNTLFNNSKTLYVELISPESKIIVRNVTQLEEGLGHGDMILADSIGVKPGTYQLRAYTNWMRNFGDDFIFKKEIQIIPQSKENETIVSDNERVQKTIVDFFPEGGSLIENIKSNVAFKATDQYGNPIDIEGTVFDKNGKTITKLKSSHDGMGKFAITPEKDQKYYAEITTPENKKIKVPIPKAEEKGYALSMNFIKGKKVITIKTNQKTLSEKPNSPLTLVCSTRGVAYYVASQALQQTQTSFLLPEDNFPEGIAQITLFDDESKPQSERLIYIEKDHGLSVSITTDKIEYLPKEKINITVSAKDKENKPLVASFSIAANDTNGTVNEPDNNINICSYFLMASDIKGKINNPGYYFNLFNPERIPHLDLLLLTQGWRDFVWKKIPSPKEAPDFIAEKGIKISGKIEKTFSSAGKENSLIKMILTKKENFIMLNDTTDSEGRFKFDNLAFTGEAKLFLNSQNEKGKNSGHIFLDSIYNKAISTDFKSHGLINPEKNKIDRLEENIHQKNIFFNIPIENRLDDVIVTTEKKKPQGQSLYGFADYTYIPEENKGPYFNNIFKLIQFYIPNVTVTGNSVRFNRYNGPPLILVDGIETENDILGGMNPEEIAKIEVIKTSRAAVFGTKGGNGAILIYTKLGGPGKANKRISYSTTKQISGYQETRVFYSPNYEKAPDEDSGKPDIRNTLYWNPYVNLNQEGNADISFYNSEVNTTVKVTLEGITNDGIPIVVNKNYTIKK